MSLFISSINSGSNGNCYYIGNDNEAVFVDAGLSCREIEKRMGRLGLDIGRLKAVFISHEHSDHIFGVATLAKKYQLPVYITANTLLHGKIPIEEHLVRHFSPYQPVTIGGMTITGFPKFHDACDPHSFVVSSDTTNVGIFTDIGNACKHVIHHFKLCHAAFLEANYDDDMLNNGRYPIHLKNRIRGNNGHLSNRQAFDLFTQHRPSYMSHLLLSHLSKDNNCPELVERLFTGNDHGAKIVVASRFQETAIYRVEGKSLPAVAIPHPYAQARPVQLRLF